eukprot:4373705-Prymnesium_polylepis.1
MLSLSWRSERFPEERSSRSRGLKPLGPRPDMVDDMRSARAVGVFAEGVHAKQGGAEASQDSLGTLATQENNCFPSAWRLTHDPQRRAHTPP